METQPTICLESITKRFLLGLDGGFTAIEDVSLEAHHGEFVWLWALPVAENPHLLSMISGLLSPARSHPVEGEEVTGIRLAPPAD